MSKYDAVRKSWHAETSGSPFFGVTKLFVTHIKIAASARASSVCGRCKFISSPSKSALYGAQTHSLNLNVRSSITFTV